MKKVTSISTVVLTGLIAATLVFPAQAFAQACSYQYYCNVYGFCWYRYICW